MSRRTLAVKVAVLLAMACVMAPVSAQEKAKKPLIQMAILLDTSNSMDGLISQAKSELWKIVNEFALAKKEGVRPDLEVALYEYGNDGIKDEGYIRLVLPLTNDLDKISEKLFALTTNGGSEHCGQVIKAASNGLKWSADKDTLKVIFIAGNEPFTQGPVDYKEACKAAITSGIIVNTIHCGTQEEGIEGKWKDGALLADGRYINIDQDKAVPHIDAPQDAEITRLGEELNLTYIPFGYAGAEASKRQMAQDSNAASMSANSASQRAVFKASAQYNNAGWDLVDAVQQGSVKLEEVKTEDLPKDMQAMSVEQRKAHLQKNQAARTDLQARIQKLDADRKKFVAEKLQEMEKASGAETLDSAMIKAVREQATRKNFKFE